MKHRRCAEVLQSIGALALLAGSTAAHGELLLSQLVVELAPGEEARADIEVGNSGPDRSFVQIEAREMIAPGTTLQSTRSDPDPDKLGLLVSPQRLVLEPGQRRMLRVASIAPGDRERVYRVMVKPVVGELSSTASGLKVLVGYDVLVLVRPAQPKPHVSGVRTGAQLSLTNDGNVSVELIDGRACDASLRNCSDLPSGRLYAGAQRIVSVGAASRVHYDLRVGSMLVPADF